MSKFRRDIPDGLRYVWIVLAVISAAIGIAIQDATFLAAGGFVLGQLL